MTNTQNPYRGQHGGRRPGAGRPPGSGPLRAAYLAIQAARRGKQALSPDLAALAIAVVTACHNVALARAAAEQAEATRNAAEWRLFTHCGGCGGPGGLTPGLAVKRQGMIVEAGYQAL